MTQLSSLSDGTPVAEIKILESNDNFFERYNTEDTLYLTNRKTDCVEAYWKLYEVDIVPASAKEIKEFLFGGNN